MADTWQDRLSRAISDLGAYGQRSYDELSRGVQSIPGAVEHYAQEYGKPAAEFAANLLPGAGLAGGWQDSGRGADALKRGDYGQAAIDYANTGLNVAAEVLPPLKLAPAILAGIGARGAPLARLKIAEEMERAGAAPAAIWKQVGWERGKDGQWRYEIPDQSSRIVSDVADDWEMGFPATMRDLLYHPELYAAYPQIGDLPVKIEPNPNYGGSYAGGHVNLKPSAFDDKIRSTLLHEAQHAVQGAEGFAGGIAPQEAVRQYTLQALWRNPQMDDQGWEEIQRALQDKEALGRELYRVNAGEVEARNVQLRRDYDDSERRIEPPSFSEPVPRDEQVISIIAARPPSPPGMADGGAAEPEHFAEMERAGYHHAGVFPSAVPGRTDELPVTVASGAYILPADVVSALGEGNTLAGVKALESTIGEHKPRFAAGGGVKIIAAGGEYAIPPEVVRKLGDGDMDKGHNALDAFVKRVRAKNIKTLKALPGPAQ